METRNTRTGLLFFGFYLILYCGFVLVNAFAPEMMEKTPLPGVFPGINIAILYGIGLILTALVLSLIYGILCRPAQEQPRNKGDE